MERIIAAEPGKAPAARAEALGLDAALLISQSRCSPHVIVVAKVAVACPDKIYPFSGPSMRTRHLTRLENFIGLVRLEDKTMRVDCSCQGTPALQKAESALSAQRMTAEISVSDHHT